MNAFGTNFTYTLLPNAGLSAGTYTETVTVTYNDGAQATADVSFTVNQAPVPVKVSVGASWYVGDSINLSGNYYIADDSSESVKLAGNRENTVPAPSGEYLESCNQWIFEDVIYTDPDSADLWLTLPQGKTASDVPIVFRLASGTGTRENPLRFELIVITDPYIADSRITLPDDLREIEAAAFSGVSARVVEVPGGVERIGAKAFANSSVQLVLLPDSTLEIASDAFEGCRLTAVYGYTEAAESLAEKSGALYVDMNNSGGSN